MSFVFILSRKMKNKVTVSFIEVRPRVIFLKTKRVHDLRSFFLPGSSIRRTLHWAGSRNRDPRTTVNPHHQSGTPQPSSTHLLQSIAGSTQARVIFVKKIELQLQYVQLTVKIKSGTYILYIYIYYIVYRSLIKSSAVEKTETLFFRNLSQS